ncbi:MAG TPA: PilZ domain-containing protein [Spirochaetales bacterium]|nr:PilZ domain-containing protein [Spirochaetales bacterium]HPG85705.1 PilZ domain-containing protein [Spirochaetales bacterium]HPM73684.1 PilZ domain-containing protein [Spirochaetales bacterium]
MESETSQPPEDQGLERNGLFGKKVFFLNPPGVIGDVANALAEAEFEVYSTRDHAKLARFLRKEPECLTFVNIDEGDDESVWRAWIKSIKGEEASARAAFGIITMLDDEDKRSYYLMDLGVECGFVVVKIGVAKTTEILLRMLEANEARGRRRYVRAACPPDSTELSCPTDEGLLRGWIKDLSSVGMSVAFAGGATPRQGSRLRDMQLNLKGVRVILNGVVIGSHDAPGIGVISVIMFEPASVNDDKRAKLRAFIRRTLQATMDKALSLA